jgi:hypothetical protein
MTKLIIFTHTKIRFADRASVYMSIHPDGAKTNLFLIKHNTGGYLGEDDIDYNICFRLSTTTRLIQTPVKAE